MKWGPYKIHYLYWNEKVVVCTLQHKELYTLIKV